VYVLKINNKIGNETVETRSYLAGYFAQSDLGSKIHARGKVTALIDEARYLK
jgi:hypothetical protein